MPSYACTHLHTTTHKHTRALTLTQKTVFSARAVWMDTLFQGKVGKGLPAASFSLPTCTATRRTHGNALKRSLSLHNESAVPGRGRMAECYPRNATECGVSHGGDANLWTGALIWEAYPRAVPGRSRRRGRAVVPFKGLAFGRPRACLFSPRGTQTARPHSQATQPGHLEKSHSHAPPRCVQRHTPGSVRGTAVASGAGLVPPSPEP